VSEQENGKEDSNSIFSGPCDNFVKDGSVYILGDFDSSISKNVIPEMVKMIDEKKKMSEPKIDIYINSAGGIVSELIGLLSVIQLAKNAGIAICTYNIGMAHSCGSLLFIHGDARVMYRNAESLMHLGNTGDFYSTYEQLERSTKRTKWHFDRIVNMYVEHTKMNRKKIEKILKDDCCYMNAEECLKNGICDAIF
jgi:ATP-dependent protease ClpP protease subunit